MQSRAAGSTAGFQYRIVARRKDLANTRLEKVAPPPPDTWPAPKLPDLTEISKPPATLEQPAGPSR